jgi:beta-lactamase superfamily II metal-dependent hydrolase
MLFTLEALDAKHGDALLLHYGPLADPRLIVIDGGPGGVWTKRLRPRLAALQASRARGRGLEIVAAVVSHIDDDHVNGILAMFNDVERRRNDGDPAELSVLGLWHNSFEDLTPTVDPAALGDAAATLKPVALGGAVPARLGMKRPAALVLASVPQGRDLRNVARRLGVPMNLDGQGGLITAPAAGGRRENVGDGLRVTVVGPLGPQIEALRADWAKQIAKLKKAGKLTPASLQVTLADYVDRSVNNLSSIVLLAEAGGKRMLLTGDARGDFILEGARKAGLLKAGRMHVDLLKLPHHGSIRDVKREFFEQITADHYVISADGRFDNPDVDTLKALFAARPKGPYALYLTNRIPRVAKFLAAKAPKGVRVITRRSADPSVVVDLGDRLKD